MIWIRETENIDFGTPERRAGLERRLSEIAREIRDEALRRYYQAEFKDRLFQFFGRGGSPRFKGVASAARTAGPKPRWQRSSEAQSHLAPPAVSRSLALSPLFRPGKSSLPPREGLILLLLLNHPGLIGPLIEDLAELAFSSAEAGALRDALIAFVASPAAEPSPGQPIGEPSLDAASLDAASLRAATEGQGFGPILQKLDAMAAHASHWYVKAGAAEADAGEVLKQALSLHRRARALHKELQLAELALGKDSSEANLGRLMDIQAQLSALGGIEAVMGGFGAQSGRPGGTLCPGRGTQAGAL